MSSRPDVTRMLTLAAYVWLQRRGGQIFTELPLRGTKAMQDREQQLEQSLWLDGVKAA